MSRRVLMVTPAPRGSRKGNRITAERWAGLLRGLGHRVSLVDAYAGQPAELLIALHAAKSADAIAAFRAQHANSPIVVALTGTDVYRPGGWTRAAERSLDLATRIVVLQPEAVRRLDARWRRKAVVILQSATPPTVIRPPREDGFEVCVVGHLRPVKDPLRAALASRRLPADSTIRIVQIGAALTPAMARRAEREAAINPRFEWVGELSHEQSKQRMARCRLLVLSSRLEGGANVISEAIVAGVPVVSTRIDGSIGLLGRKYPGYFAGGDTQELARLLLRAERDPEFLRMLSAWCEQLRAQFTPAAEAASWRDLLSQITAPSIRNRV